MQDVWNGWSDALKELGVVVGDFNLDRRLEFYSNAKLEIDGELRTALQYDAAVQLANRGLLAECYAFVPDVVIVVTGIFIDLNILEIIRRPGGPKVVFIFTESPYEDDRQLKQAEYADLILLNDPTNLEQFRAINPESYYVPHAYDPKKHHPGPADPDKECDFAFVGTGFPSRVTFLEAVDWSGIDVKLAGTWQALKHDSVLRPFVAHRLDWACANEEAADLYRSAKTSLNLYRREASEDAHAEGWSMGPREVELAACGLWFARDSRPEGDELFPMLPIFTSPEEAGDQIRWALAHDLEREEAALKATAAIADRTFEANARWLLSHLDK